MALRYPILFPCGEQSWMATIPLLGHENNRSLLARRPGAALRSLHQHGLQYDGDEGEGPEPSQDEQQDEDSGARCGGGVRNVSTRRNPISTSFG